MDAQGQPGPVASGGAAQVDDPAPADVPRGGVPPAASADQRAERAGRAVPGLVGADRVGGGGGAEQGNLQLERGNRDDLPGAEGDAAVGGGLTQSDAGGDRVRGGRPRLALPAG